MRGHYRALRGTRDILPDEAARWQYLENKTREVLQRYGFREIRTPVLEATELFARSVGASTDIVTKEMYTFPSSDESVTLRPEATASVVRAFVEHALHRGVAEGFPERLYYIGPMFRHERPQKGRQRQFHQIGAEVLGSSEPLADAETIEMAWTLLEALGLRGCELRLNSVGDTRCRPGYREALQSWLRPRLTRLCEDCRRRFESNPLRVFDCKVEADRKLLEEAPMLPELLCDPCRQHLAAVRAVLEQAGVAHAVDSTIVRGLDYYERTVFEIVSPELGAQNSVLGGGRYDGLVQELGGPAMPGFGFAAGMERLLMLMPPERGAPEGSEIALISIGAEAWKASLALARRLRGQGLRVSVPLSERPVQAQLRRADRAGARFAVILGEEELRTGRLQLKDLKAGRQTAVAEADLPTAVRGAQHGAGDP